MRILVFSQFYYPEPFRISDICETLVELGNEVTVVTTFPNYPDGEIYDGYKNEEKREELLNGVKVIRYKSIPRHTGIKYLALSYVSYAFNVCKKIKDFKNEKFDVIYVYQLSPIFMALPAIKYKKKYKIPLYLYCLDIWPESIVDVFPNEKSFLYKFTRIISAYIYNKADRIGITSRYFKKYLQDVCNVSEEKICYLPQHCVDTGFVEREKSQDDTINIFYMGNVGESQNIEVMAEAAELMKDYEKFKFHVVGTGSCFEKLKKIVDDRKLHDKVILHGRYPSSEMNRFYKQADACLLILSGMNKIGYTVPGKLQGYMAAGKPVIASIAGDSVDVINEAKCGICSKADSAKDLADAYKIFMSDIEKYRRCGINGRKFYEDNFTIKKHVESLMKELEDMKKHI